MGAAAQGLGRPTVVAERTNAATVHKLVMLRLAQAAAVGWVTLQLTPGRYELVCNLKNHYANGMYQELDVR